VAVTMARELAYAMAIPTNGNAGAAMAAYASNAGIRSVFFVRRHARRERARNGHARGVDLPG